VNLKSEARFKKRIKALFKNTFFWKLTLFGNAIILAGSVLLFVFESQLQTPPADFLDCILWSAGTVTTIGYGNLTTFSTPGKLTLLALMLTGTAFVWTYMAFLVTRFIAPELSLLEKDMHDVEKEIQNFKMEKSK
jgi:hypothetical protein